MSTLPPRSRMDHRKSSPRRQVRPRLEFLEDRRLLAGLPPTITEFPLAPAPSAPLSIALGGDGNLYYSNTSANAIGRVTPQGVITEFPLPTNTGGPGDLELGPDGNIWFVESAGIGRLVPSTGVITEFTAGFPANTAPAFLDTGPDGALWFTDFGANAIGRITTSGVVTNSIPVPTANAGLNGISQGPNGTLWFLEGNTNVMGQINPFTGAINEATLNLPAGANPFEIYWSGVPTDNFLFFTQNGANAIGLFNTSAAPGSRFVGSIPGTAGGAPTGLTRASDGAIYVTEQGTHTIGKIVGGATPTVSLPTPTPGSTPSSIVVGSDGALWFTENTGNKIGRLTTGGAFTEFAIPGKTTTPTDIVAGPDGALWFTQGSSNTLGRITTSGVSTTFPIPTSTNSTGGIARGNDGNLYFTEVGSGVGTVGVITTAGAITEFPSPSAGSTPGFITSGPDGNLWFTDAGTNSISRLSRNGTIVPVTIPTANSSPSGITSGPDGNLWFTEAAAGKIGRISPITGLITEFNIPTPASIPLFITSGPDGNLWFTETNTNKIGRITTTGFITEFTVPTFNSGPAGIVTGPDGNIWFVESNSDKLGQITPAGLITEYPLPSVGGSATAITLGPDGNLWYTSSTGNRIGKVVIPAAVNPLTATLAPGSDLGASNSDFLTSVATPVFTGTSAPGAAITIFAQGQTFLTGATPIGVATAAANGTWTATPFLSLADDRYQITIGSIAPGGATAVISLTSAAKPLVISTTGPVIQSVTLVGKRITISFKSSVGLDLTALSNKAAYGVAGKGVNTITTVTATRSGTNATVILNFSTRRGFNKKATLLVRALLATDLAGNALDGEFTNRLPTGDGIPGGFFLATLPLKKKRGLFFNGGGITIII